MALKLGLGFIKYTLIIISFVYLLTAAVLATIGATIMERFSVQYFFEDDFIAVGKMLFITGLILLFVSLIGVVGSGRESTLMINIFGGLICILLAVEVLAAILINKVKEDALDKFDHLYTTGMEHYHDDAALQESFDFVQHAFGCCGRNSFEEWLDVENNIPASCCFKWEMGESDTNSTATCVQYFGTGCIQRMRIFLNKKSTTMGIIAIILTQFIGMLLVFTLAKSIRNAKTVREMQKWQVREQIAAQNVQNLAKEDVHPKGILIPTTDDSHA